ncbi:glycosyltransferase family 2 protein [Chroococcus sp. FPU101]|uniref:glycosyltransferase family 2 protein n=1 Tax=Chroococcus sp. FPU101 TaxID=1974212 RepID=UPI001A90368C|nr:glycosyltransferase family 2 protein [Chroococcus sp. FPU101]GFE68439.1 glycosyl transferase family protein [Chroococcus sp. FPU101]
MYKIAAYITAYQDLEAVKKCLISLRNQTYNINKIFVIDNSPEMLKFDLLLEQDVILEHHPENIGIAAGIKIASKWAIEENYDFLWTFDQDSEPISDTLEKLLENYERLIQQGLSIGIVAPLVIDSQSNQELEGAIFHKYKFFPASNFENINPRKFYKKDFYECDIVITSGSLVNLDAAKNVDFPNEELFIDAVDWAYCMNFREKQYHVVVVTTALLKHNFGKFQSTQNIGVTKIPIYAYSTLRYYYTSRNHTFIENHLAKKSNSFHLSILYRLRTLIQKSIKIMLYEPDYKLLKIWACFKGTYDGFLGKLGKNW